MNIAGLVRYSTLVRYGLLALVVGAGLVGYGLLHQLPSEADLQSVTGKAEKGTKVTTKRRRGGESVVYELEVAATDGTKLKLRVPANEISEREALAVLNARSMSAKFDSESDVYVLAADGREILSYAKTRERRSSSDSTLAQMGSYVFGGGLLLGLIGWLRNRKAVA